MKIKRTIIALACTVVLVAAIGIPAAFAAGGYHHGYDACDGTGQGVAVCTSQNCETASGENCDGICDNQGNGPADGTGHHYGTENCPADGTGNGPADGTCHHYGAENGGNADASQHHGSGHDGAHHGER